MSAEAVSGDIDRVVERIHSLNDPSETIVHCEVVRGDSQTIIAVKGDVTRLDPAVIQEINGVDRVERISDPCPTIARRLSGGVQRATRIADIGPHKLGGSRILVGAGTCSVRDLDHFATSIDVVANAGADFSRGNAFKPRTSPYAFQGLGAEILADLARISHERGLPLANELTGTFRYLVNGRNRPLSPQEAQAIHDKRQSVVEEGMQHIDFPWIGARNGQCFDLIQASAVEAIIHGRPLMIKRSPSSTIEEFRFVLEYAARLGCDVVGCLRGTVNVAGGFRNNPDVGDIMLLKETTCVPIIADPSHMAGNWRYVEKLAEMALVAGADGLLIEISTNREQELTDGAQAVSPECLKEIVEMARSFSQRR